MPTRRNPIARSPLLRKGGAHTSTASGQRQRRQQQVQDEIHEWMDDKANPHHRPKPVATDQSSAPILRHGQPSGMVDEKFF